MTIDLFDNPAPVIKRDRYGRPLIPSPGGGEEVANTRASTLAGTLADGAGIAKWKCRHVALGIGRHEDLAAMAAGLEYGDPKLDDIVETAVDRAGCNAKANYGTAVHTFTERDSTDFVPQRMRGDVDAYNETLAKLDITPAAAEVFVVCDELRVAGTFDHIYRVPVDLLAESGPLEVPSWVSAESYMYVIGDKKTGSLHFHDHAIQLAVYAHSDAFDAATGTRTPLHVNREVGLVVHIPAGKGECTVHAVDLVAGWEAAKLAVAVRDWRARKDIAREVTA